MQSVRREISKLLRSPIARGRVSKCILLLTICNIYLFFTKLPGPICWTPPDRYNASFDRVQHLKFFHTKIKEEDLPEHNNTEFKHRRLEDIEAFNILNGMRNTRYCYEGGKKSSDLIVIIKSNLESFKTRSAIRMTWGHYHLHSKISIIFVSSPSSILPDTINNQLKEELNLYGDVVVNQGPFAKNPNVERLFILTWLNINCPEALMILIVRDNVFVNFPALITTWTVNEIKVNDTIYGRIETREEKNYPLHKQTSHHWNPTAVYFSYSFLPVLLNKAWEQKLSNTKNTVHETLMADSSVRKIRIQQTLNAPNKPDLFYCFLDEAICVELEDDKWPVEYFPLWHHTSVNSGVCTRKNSDNNTSTISVIMNYNNRVDTQFVF